MSFAAQPEAKVLSENTPDPEIDPEYVTQASLLREYAVLAKPGLALDEDIVCSARIPTAGEVVSWQPEGRDNAAE